MATTPTAAATPSPPSHINTPPTPRLGFADSWEPFSPRKSSRIANAKSAAAASSSSSTTSARTPSPSSASRRAARLLRSPRQTKQSVPAPTQPQQLTAHHPNTLSPAPTPRKKRTMPAAHFFSPESTRKSKSMAADAFAADGEDSSQMRMGMGTLPTPAKTPSKKVHAASQNESNIAAIARNLFHTDVDDVMSSPSKTPSRKAKKYTGTSLESFAVVEEEDPISIFTDSQDRVPEADSSIDNPFFGGGAATVPSAPEASRRRSKRNHVSIPGEGKQSVEDATRRDDGLVYVFRGKKIFRKFEESSASLEEDVLPSASAGKRLTRSAIKPRLLFPRQAHSVIRSENTLGSQSEDDEEAVTDIEDHNLEDASDDELEKAEELEQTEEVEEAVVVATSTGHAGKAATPNTPPNAPNAPRFAPNSPPVSVRTTRSGHKAAVPEETTPAKPAAAKKRSPFDGWRQTKSTAGSAAGHKRSADELGSAIPTAGHKRSRI